jgi:DnaJ-class molecular chaperone
MTRKPPEACPRCNGTGREVKIHRAGSIGPRATTDVVEYLPCPQCNGDGIPGAPRPVPARDRRRDAM